MRLKCIKLAGFKSFVDPTTIPFPTNLSAVVGPNGCGKSNTIDAVRWVMGESSAKHLRGESMTDVIFNGSNARKPVGQCTVELIFDNSDHTLKGEYAAFNEISIRRRVTRDGKSDYFLNGTKCRRKDVTDLFLGTGLGSRSYAIIEQGMISRLIEAKPEDLRNTIEEAAGISRYKERRRETENRMRRTRENLERLTDIREELERQLQHLHRQAQAAERYKEYKQEERTTRAQLSALRWQALDDEVSQQELRIAEFETRYESFVSDQRAIDADHEALREEHYQVTEQFNDVQARYYQLGNEIARFEQTMQHRQEQSHQLVQDVQEAERQLHEADLESQADRDRSEQSQKRLSLIEPDIEAGEERLSLCQDELARFEEQQSQWQQKWDHFNQNAQGPKRQAEVAQSKIQHLERVIEQLHRRQETLYRERDQLDADPDAGNLEALFAQTEELEEKSEQAQMQLDELGERLQTAREDGERKRSQFENLRQQWQMKQGRQSTLEALIKASMGDEAEGVQNWLASQQMREAPRLAQQLQVQSGWEKAVETVLADRLQAVCVESLDSLAQAAVERLKDGSLTLIQSQPGVAGHAESLAAKVSSDYDLAHWLGSVLTVNTLDEGLSRLHELAPHQSFITKEGVWLGSGWVRVKSGEASAEGLLSLQQELEQLEEELDELEAEVEDLEVGLNASLMQQNAIEGEREQLQRDNQQLSRQLAEVKAELSGKRVQAEQMRERRQRLSRDIDDVDGQIQEERESLAMTREELQQSLDSMEEDVEEREQLLAQREEVRILVDEKRDELRQLREAHHQLQLQQQALQTEVRSLQSSLERAQQQKSRAEERLTRLREQLDQRQDPLDDLKEALEEKLEARLELEQELNDRRSRMESADARMRELEQKRAAAEQQAQSVRSELEQQKMAAQTQITRRATLAEQLREAQFDLDTLLANMPEGAAESEWEAALERIAARIQRLGPINLAAIEEYQTQSERKRYLDDQDKDLQSALETLENAIRKIDRETRTRFKETFDRVNTGLQELFPKVFGGGHAYLELTGDDLLDTGVAIMARPPGKRNSTIHLLSGGEKALTAIALVFSIFRLNPAPFCMLDEVDAPLDDANVGRYCKLVEAMSEHVQFIYISHNKIAMEMAHQLMGVTMNEPGVSRLVSVNVEEAAELAAM